MTASAQPEYKADAHCVLPEGAALDATALWELIGAIQREVHGWQAKLPLDY